MTEAGDSSRPKRVGLSYETSSSTTGGTPDPMDIDYTNVLTLRDRSRPPDGPSLAPAPMTTPPRYLSPKTHNRYLRKFSARLYRKNQPLNLDNLIPFLELYPRPAAMSTRPPKELTPERYHHEWNRFTEGLLRTNQDIGDEAYEPFHATFVRVVRALPDTSVEDLDRVDTPPDTSMGDLDRDKEARKAKRDRLKKRSASKKGKEKAQEEESGSEGVDGPGPGVSASGDVAGTSRPIVSVPRASFNTSGFTQNMDPLGSTSNPMEIGSDDASEEDPFIRRQSTAAGKKPAVVPARDPAPPVTPVRKTKSLAEQHAEILARFTTPTKASTPRELAASRAESKEGSKNICMKIPDGQFGKRSAQWDGKRLLDQIADVRYVSAVPEQRPAFQMVLRDITTGAESDRENIARAAKMDSPTLSVTSILGWFIPREFWSTARQLRRLFKEARRHPKDERRRRAAFAAADQFKFEFEGVRRLEKRRNAGKSDAERAAAGLSSTIIRKLPWHEPDACALRELWFPLGIAVGGV
ncbi:hypothetical protein MMC07_001739 [Pseudocyphellaria aurata]|nr:hypothetical protein [Pseudocyphellaria aurata]